MINISQDPARRIRRIQRWLSEYAGVPEFDVLLIGDDDSLHDKRVFELMRLAGLELDWLCKFTVDARNVWDRDIGYAERTIAEQKARIEVLASQIETERAVLGDVKSWANEYIKELVDETWNLGTETEEQDEKIGELIGVIKRQNHRIDILEARVNRYTCWPCAEFDE